MAMQNLDVVHGVDLDLHSAQNSVGTATKVAAMQSAEKGHLHGRERTPTGELVI